MRKLVSKVAAVAVVALAGCGDPSSESNTTIASSVPPAQRGPGELAVLDGPADAQPLLLEEGVLALVASSERSLSVTRHDLRGSEPTTSTLFEQRLADPIVAVVARQHDGRVALFVQSCAEPPRPSGDLQDLCAAGSRYDVTLLDATSGDVERSHRIDGSGDLVDAHLTDGWMAAELGGQMHLVPTEGPLVEHVLAEPGLDACVFGEWLLRRPQELAMAAPTTVAAGAPVGSAYEHVLAARLPEASDEVRITLGVEPGGTSCGPTSALVAGSSGGEGRVLSIDDEPSPAPRDVTALHGAVQLATSTRSQHQLALVLAHGGGAAGAVLVSEAGRVVHRWDGDDGWALAATYLSSGEEIWSVSARGTSWTVTVLDRGAGG